MRADVRFGIAAHRRPEPHRQLHAIAADVTIATAFFSGGIMRHPALRRSARHSSKREARAEAAKAAGAQGASAPPADHDPAGQNRPAPGVPPDGEHNQGGVRREGIDYQRDLGSEQDS